MKVLLVLICLGCIDEAALRAEVSDAEDRVALICQKQAEQAAAVCEAKADEAALACQQAIDELKAWAEEKAREQLIDLGCVEVEGPPGWECPCFP